MLAAIWAQDQSGLIGRNNKLPWNLPNDLAHFKGLTLGKTIIMGRKTFDGLGKKPLPKRQNIILTRDTSYSTEANILLFHQVEDVLSFVKGSDKDSMIIGGSSIYKLFEPYIEELYVTRIHEYFEGDAYFPDWPWEDFELLSQEEGQMDAKNLYPHVFEHYRRKSSFK